MIEGLGGIFWMLEKCARIGVSSLVALIGGPNGDLLLEEGAEVLSVFTAAR